MQTDARMVVALMRAVVETVAETDPAVGAPGGVLYAGLTSAGLQLAQYQRLMDGLVDADLLQRRGQCYFITPKGRQFAQLA